MIHIKPMEAIELFPNLSPCIESATRKEFWNSVSQYVGGGETDRKLEERIELLRPFLESADFKKLRNQSEKHLIEGKKVKFVICWKEAEPSYEMVVIEVCHL
ncbi:MAG: hypothetical protein A2Z77_01670 [Chloroflexi bacterium RBG_13_51_36]|nr:MAG: hypothetical protein A2Z77_01670 [Chloroflexi bacterium RBG_13_51_36]